MTDIKMLPLPEDAIEWLRQYGVANTAFQRWFQAYARDVAEHNVAARDAEIAQLRSANEALREESAKRYGIDPWAVLLRAQEAEALAERLAEALETCLEVEERPSIIEMARDALRDHDQEVNE